MPHQFNYTTSQRRASTSIVGSLGRSGLFIPQDFIKHDKKDLDEVLETMDADEDGRFDLPLAEGRASRPGMGHRHDSITILKEEASLLQANRIPIKKSYEDDNGSPNKRSGSGAGYGSVSHAGQGRVFDNIADINDNNEEEMDAIMDSWDEAVRTGKISTTTVFEIKTLTESSIPLILTFLLQNSLSICSIFAVGHISSEALAGISLGSMTSNITAIATIAGLASSLDTFLPQAYGAKKYHLVGLIFQRCTLLIFFIMTIVCISWWLFAESVLMALIPDKEASRYAAQYLKVTTFGMPGYILFETGKRYLQAQGIFDASTYVLFVCAPLNAIMNYVFVWVLDFGYVGAPLAVAINYTLMALGLFAYTITTKNDIKPLKCWNGVQLNKALRNWSELLKLSIPNLIMIVSEFLSFEILTLLSSYLGTSSLAAQSVLGTMASLTYQVPYGVSIAASTRIANYLGSELPKNAYITCKASFYFTIVIGAFNFSFLYFGRDVIANWFTNDQEVIAIVYETCPIVAFMQIFDAVNSVTAGCMRGQGTQKIGGYANLTCYYLLGLPLSFYFAFYVAKGDRALGLVGLWGGITFALAIICSIQSYFVLNADFNKLVQDALRRANSD